MTIQPNSINQKQSIREPRIYSAVPRDVMVHIVENIRGVDDPVRFLEAMNTRVERYKNEGMLTVGADLHLPSNILAPEDKSLLPDGFKLNTIDRVLAYVTILSVLYQVFSSSSEGSLEVNQLFIERCENCFLQILKE